MAGVARLDQTVGGPRSRVGAVLGNKHAVFWERHYVSVELAALGNSVNHGIHARAQLRMFDLLQGLTCAHKKATRVRSRKFFFPKWIGLPRVRGRLTGALAKLQQQIIG